MEPTILLTTLQVVFMVVVVQSTRYTVLCLVSMEPVTLSVTQPILVVVPSIHQTILHSASMDSAILPTTWHTWEELSMHILALHCH